MHFNLDPINYRAIYLIVRFVINLCVIKESAIRKLNELLADDAVGSNPILRLVAGTVLMHERDYAGALKHTNSGGTMEL